jgi:hypothetical protein
MLKQRTSTFTTEFDPSQPRYTQAWALERFVVAYARKGLTQEFTGACRKLGVKNYVAIERLVDKFVAGEVTL